MQACTCKKRIKKLAGLNTLKLDNKPKPTQQYKLHAKTLELDQTNETVNLQQIITLNFYHFCSFVSFQYVVHEKK